jgi:exodeoxyribonuclease VII large subunit
LKTYVVTGIGHEVDTSLSDLASDHRAATPTAAAEFVTLDQSHVWDRLLQYNSWMTRAMQARLDQAETELTHLISNPWLANPMAWVQDKELTLANLVQSLEYSGTALLAKDRQALQSFNQQLMDASPQACMQKQQLELAKLSSSIAASLQNAVVENKSDLKHMKSDLAQGTANTLALSTQAFKRQAALLDACSPLKILSRGYSLATLNGKVLRNADQLHIGDIIHIELNTGSADAQVQEVKS